MSQNLDLVFEMASVMRLLRSTGSLLTTETSMTLITYDFEITVPIHVPRKSEGDDRRKAELDAAKEIVRQINLLS